MLQAILYLSNSSPLNMFSFLFRLHAQTINVYDVIIYFVRLTQMFATADHNFKIFSEIAPFLQKSVY